jgi:HlyD family secretion protein
MTELPSSLPDASSSSVSPAPAQLSAAQTAAARSRGTRRPARWLIWPLLILVVGGGAGLLLRRGSAAPAAVYPTDTAVQGTVSILVSGPGTLAPGVSVPDPAPTSGIVTGLPPVGAMLKAGQVMGQIRSDSNTQAVQDAVLGLEKAQAQLNVQQASQEALQAGRQSSSTSARLNVQDAQDTLNTAETTLSSQQQLYALGAISRVELDSARAAVQSARNKLASAQAALSSAAQQSSTGAVSDVSTLRTLQLAVQQAQATLKTARTTLAAQVLRAPASGVVTSVDVLNGSNVNAGTSLLTIADTSVMQLPVQIDETQISQVKPGMLVRAGLDALEGQTIEGRVISVSPTATVQNNISVFTVNAELPNPQGLLKAGMSAQSDVVVAEQAGLVVASKAVQAVRTRSYVQVVPPATLQAAADLAPQTTTGAAYSQNQAASAVQLNDRGAATAVQTRVQVGLTDGTSIVVTDGLQEGDTVLLPQVVARSTGTRGTGTGIPGIGVGSGGTGGGFRGGN